MRKVAFANAQGHQQRSTLPGETSVESALMLNLKFMCKMASCSNEGEQAAHNKNMTVDHLGVSFWSKVVDELTAANLPKTICLPLCE